MNKKPKMIDRPSLTTLRERIAKICRHDEAVIAAYIFGSQGTRRQRPQSDVDVAVLLDEKHAKPFCLLTFAVEVERACGCRADIVILNHAEEIVKREVRRTGIVVFDRDPGIRKRFEVMGRKTYEDFLHLHQKYVSKVLYRQ